MVRSIDRSFSRFGGEHVPYHSIKSIAVSVQNFKRVVLSSCTENSVKITSLNGSKVEALP